MRKLLLITAMAVLGFEIAEAQLTEEDFKLFNHVSVGVSAGTDGIGFQVAAPLGNLVTMRVGYSFMPAFKYKKTFDIGNDPAFTTHDLDLEAKLKMNQFSLLFDYYPFTHSSFRLTAGAYIGNNKIVNAYNKTPFVEASQWGTAGIQLAEGGNVYDKYTIVTDKNGNIEANLKVNGFRPYIGIGFGRSVPRKRIGLSFDLGVQVWGTPKVMTNLMYFDGNEGEFVTRNEKINKNKITRTDKDYKKIKDAVKTIQKFGVYPVLTFRLNGRLF
jgi:hypothetical protein